MKRFTETATLQTRIIAWRKFKTHFIIAPLFFEKKEKWGCWIFNPWPTQKNVFIRPNCPISEQIALKQDCVYSAVPGQCFGKLKVHPMFFIVWPAHTRLGLLYFSAA
jgi:hypothetical protein